MRACFANRRISVAEQFRAPRGLGAPHAAHTAEFPASIGRDTARLENFAFALVFVVAIPSIVGMFTPKVRDTPPPSTRLSLLPIL